MTAISLEYSAISEPAPLVLPPISISLPASRSPSRLPSPVHKARAASVPTSPINKTRRASLFDDIRGNVRRGSLLPAPSMGSPSRYLSSRVHKYCASFTTAARKSVEEAACPVHAYQGQPGPRTRRGSAVFGTALRESLVPDVALCPQHAYATPASTLLRTGATAFAKDALRGEPSTSGPGVHAYAAAESTLSRKGATAFNKEERRGEVTSSGPNVHVYCASPRKLTTLSAKGAAAFSKDVSAAQPAPSGPTVHAYAAARSTLAQTGATAFSQAKRGGEAPRGRAPVHAYAAPSSTLRKAGAVPFGSTASRGLDLTALTRTGLLSATPTPRAPRTLPKLVVPRRAMSPTAIEDALADAPIDEAAQHSAAIAT